MARWCTAWMSTLPFLHWCRWDSCLLDVGLDVGGEAAESLSERQCVSAKVGCGGLVERLLCYAEE